MRQKTKSGSFGLLVGLLFLGFFAWWLYINLALRSADHNNFHNQAFGATYGVIALLGGAAGIMASKKWGGSKSLLGRALLFFAIGLLAQEFGQIVYSYYTYVAKVDIPYPSIGDIGYFGSVLFYIYAAWLLAKSTGIKFTFRTRYKKFLAVAIAVILLAASYSFFLRDYQFDFSDIKATLRVVLDFGYPLGQAVYVAIALLTYLFTRGILGGIMKNKVLWVLLALFVQYIADFTFLNAAKNNTPFPGGANDLMYLISYTVMTFALYSFLSSLSTKPKHPVPAKSEEGAA